MPQVREFEIPRQLSRWKRCLKVYSRCFILYRDFSNSLALWNVGEISWGWSREAIPHGKEMLKKRILKTERCMGKFRDCLRFISLIHSTWWDDIPYEILFPVNCILHIWLYFSHGCRAWHRNSGLMIEKWAFRISKGDQKKIKWVYLAILFQVYTSVLNTYNATK